MVFSNMGQEVNEAEFEGEPAENALLQDHINSRVVRIGETFSRM